MFDRKEYNKNYYLANKDKFKDSSRKRRKEKPEEIKEYLEKYRERNALYTRNYQLNRKFGITLEQFNKLLEEQSGVCAICKCSQIENSKHNKSTSFSVDHCHDSGKIRGLLCNNCNRSLGLFKDNIEILQSAINYLEKFKINL